MARQPKPTGEYHSLLPDEEQAKDSLAQFRNYLPKRLGNGKIICLSRRPYIASDQSIANRIAASGGLLSGAANSLNMELHELKDRIANSEQLQFVLEATREAILDVAEETLYEKIGEGDLKAATYMLDRKGGDRGYSPTSKNITEERHVHDAKVTVSLENTVDMLVKMADSLPASIAATIDVPEAEVVVTDTGDSQDADGLPVLNADDLELIDV